MNYFFIKNVKVKNSEYHILRTKTHENSEDLVFFGAYIEEHVHKSFENFHVFPQKGIFEKIISNTHSFLSVLR